MNPDNMNQPSQPMGSPTMGGGQMPITPMPEKKGMGGVIALVVIILVLLAGGYFLMQRMQGGPVPVPDAIPAATENFGTARDVDTGTQAAVDPNTVQGTSIELSDIEKDIGGTDLDALSADLEAI